MYARIFAALLLTLAVAVPAGAQSAGVFARLGFGARGMAMGNALVADGSGATSPYYNPALAPFISGQNLEGSVALMSLGRQLQYLQFSAPLRPRAGIAAGFIHGGVAGIDGRDDSGYHTEDYATDEFAFFLAFGTRVSNRVSAGLGLQVFRADYFEGLSPANSIGIDLGLSVQVTDALRLGFAADDLLARYSWDTSGLYGDGGKTTSDYFPLRLRLGAAYTALDGRLQVTAEYESRMSQAELRTRAVQLIGDGPIEMTDAETLRLQDNRFRAGAEYGLVDAFTLRAGVDNVGADGFSAARPSAGFRLGLPVGELGLSFEYAFVLEPYAVSALHLGTLRVFL